NERTGEPGGRVLGLGVWPSRRLSKRGAQQHQQPVRRVPGAAGGTGRVEHRRFLAVWQALIVLIFGLGIAHAETECSEGTSMTTNETLTLEPKAIVAFLDRFLDKGFDLERAKAIFGKVKISTNPDLLVLEGVTPRGAEEVDALLVKGALMELF